MNLSTIYATPTKRKKRKRVGRGESSGVGKTSGRGHKGQKARSGFSQKPTWEGGRMPLIRQVPKRGFTNQFKTVYAVVNVGDLNRFNDGDVVDLALLNTSGLANKIMDGVKILGYGALEKKLTVKAHTFSKSAIEKITAAGGTTEVVTGNFYRMQKSNEASE